MQRKHAFDAFAVRDATNGKCFVHSAAFPTNHHAGKYLDPLFVPFYDPGVDTNAIADRKWLGVLLLLFLLDDLEHAIHSLSTTAQQRAHTLIRRDELCNWNSYEGQ